ncbi:MAG: thermonuclease family protein [Desulfobulbus sp.]|nr:thermonuclease family protein [Desulfobulbus sp.]
MICKISSILSFGFVVFIGLYSSALAFDAEVTRILDGDSFRVRQGHTITEIRLYGIDCPEYRQAGWKQAKKMTQTLLGKGTIEIQPMDTDRYGRTVALVRTQGRLVNAELVRTGWAWVYRRYCHAQPLCRELENFEQEAQNGRRGIWQKNPPTPPWVWKRQNH